MWSMDTIIELGWVINWALDSTVANVYQKLKNHVLLNLTTNMRDWTWSQFNFWNLSKIIRRFSRNPIFKVFQSLFMFCFFLYYARRLSKLSSRTDLKLLSIYTEGVKKNNRPHALISRIIIDLKILSCKSYYIISKLIR